MALRIYTETLELIRRMSKTVIEISRHDADLGRQLRRALTSVPLNIAEGENRRDGHGRARFATAMGSANEVRACLEVAEALGYIEAHPVERDAFDRIARTLFRLTR
jgi:four helix bundle protein